MFDAETIAKRLAETEFPKILNSKLADLLEQSKKEKAIKILSASGELEGDAGNDCIDECACEEEDEDQDGKSKVGAKKASGDKADDEMETGSDEGTKKEPTKKRTSKPSEVEIYEDVNLLSLALSAGYAGSIMGGAAAVDKIKALMRHKAKIKANLQPGTPKFIGFKDGEANKLNVNRFHTQQDKNDYLDGYNIGQKFWEAKNNGLFEEAAKQLEEKRRIVIKINNKGKRRRKVMCGKGKKLVGSTCKPITGKEKQVKRVAVRKMKRTIKRKGVGAKKRALRLRKRALTKRHSMGL